MAKLDKVLITGSSRGLGEKLAKFFFGKGHEILLHGRHEITLKKIKSNLSETNLVDYYACDLNNENVLGMIATTWFGLSEIKKNEIEEIIKFSGNAFWNAE